MNRDQGVQVIAIGNAFELVHQNIESYASLTELAEADDRHFGQKSAFWSTRHGWPHVVVSTVSPSATILDSTYADRRRPEFVEPPRAASSICLDLLADSSSWRELTSALDVRRRVFLAPYVHSVHIEALADRLVSEGFTLCDYRPQAPLVRRLWSKVDAQRYLFDESVELRKYRPMSLVASSERGLADAARHFLQEGISELVVKSAAAVGGSGVFFVGSRELSRRDSLLDDLLSGSGQNNPDRSAPFLVEERVPWEVSPTVDMEVMLNGRVEIVGLALQRLYDDRYYTGFYASPLLENLWWATEILHLSKAVGAKMSSLGYVGPANVDFVVSAEPRKITLIELNPRRSALLDGFGIRKMKYGPRASVPISVVDYVNVSHRFVTLSDAIAEVRNEVPGVVLSVADGGFSSKFRWAGLWAAGSTAMDSESIMESAVTRVQDPERDEVGSAERQMTQFCRISGNAA